MALASLSQLADRLFRVSTPSVQATNRPTQDKCLTAHIQPKGIVETYFSSFDEARPFFEVWVNNTLKPAVNKIYGNLEMKVEVNEKGSSSEYNFIGDGFTLSYDVTPYSNPPVVYRGCVLVKGKLDIAKAEQLIDILLRNSYLEFKSGKPMLILARKTEGSDKYDQLLGMGKNAIKLPQINQGVTYSFVSGAIGWEHIKLS